MSLASPREISVVDELADLIQNEWDHFMRTARRVCYNPEDAQEILQNASVKALEYIATLEDRGHLKAWFDTIVRNCAYDFRRKKTRRRDVVVYVDPQSEDGSSPLELEESSEDLAPPVVAQARQIYVLVLTYIEDLTDREKTVVEMWTAGLMYEEIAERLEIALGSVKSSLFRARKKLLIMLKERHGISDLELFAD